MGVKAGWQGRFFEDFEVGDIYQHPLGRTVTEYDNTQFTLMTMNTNQMQLRGRQGVQEVGRQEGHLPRQVS
ncbi:hypothetical protein [Nocardioides daphniae]|uniref:Uncharacterized protein n=1 Tax=Nocardioides daphniae TaxID=402297 RepID=A0ABQ1QG72_9ACTN|nr:hypothetical protein [Nocardioides daphniae]GGD26687.1 hypothetical protein GCM10007231_27650 [Nocardioides daphniae]